MAVAAGVAVEIGILLEPVLYAAEDDAWKACYNDETICFSHTDPTMERTTR